MTALILAETRIQKLKGDIRPIKSILQERIEAALKKIGIDFDNDVWDVPDWDDRPTTNSDAQLVFAETSKTRRSLGDFRNNAKVAAARLRIDRGKNKHYIVNFISRVRRLTEYLTDQNIANIIEIDREVLLEFESQVLKSSDVGIGMKRLVLSTASLFFKMMEHPIDWKPRIIPQDVSAHTYAKTLKEKRLPEEVVLQVMAAVGKLAGERKKRLKENSWTIQDDRDLLVGGALVIELSTFSRMNEVLLMPFECEYDDNGYGLRMIEEKTGNPVVKPVVPEQVKLVQTLIAVIKDVTELSRRYAVAMERYFGPVVVFDGLSSSKCLFCNQQETDTSFGITERCLVALESNESVVANDFKDMIALRTNALPNGVRQKFTESFRKNYDPKQPYLMSDLSKMVIGDPTVLSYCQVAFTLGENRSGDSFSSRHGITLNGKTYIINSHQSRHFTTTILLNGDAPMPMVDKLHGRKTPGQSKRYDHPTFEEAFQRSEKSKKIPQSQLATVEDHSVVGFQHKPIYIKNDMRDEVLEVIRKEMLTGTKAKVYQALCRKCNSGAISEEEFKEQEFQHFPSFTISPTGLGFCSHAWAESPCNYHYECLANDAGDICEDLLPFVHKRALDKLAGIEADLHVSLDVIQKRGSSPAVEKWRDHIMVRLRNAARLKSEISTKLTHNNTGMLDDLMGGSSE